MAARLAQQGITDVVMLERADDIGGTWRDNRYPGCACDVPSQLYSLSFAPKPDWSRDFATSQEIWDYLRDCVRRFGLLDRIALGADVVDARWLGDRWAVTTADGREWTGDALVLAVGGLHVTKRPDIPGLATFAGPILHTADWPAEDHLTGVRVAVVGTGASAVQLVPALAPRVQVLTVFQRTASWIVPRHDRPWSPQRQRRYSRMPWTARLARWATYARLEVRVLGFGRWERARQVAEARSLAHLAAAVPDPDVRAALTPGYALGCKRVLLSDDYWPTFAQPHVSLVTEGIQAVEPTGIRTRDGVLHEVDAIVLATGFDPAGSYERMRIVGLGDRELGQVWSHERATHFGITVAGFPELYLLLGPNTALGHNSVLLQIETAIDHVLDALRRADRDGPHVVTEAAQARFGRWVRRRTRHTVWASGCDSWYLDDQGRNVTVWPASTVRYRLQARRARDRDYRRA